MAIQKNDDWFAQLDDDLDAIDDMITKLETDVIYDESGIIIGEAGKIIGEDRPEREATDIELPSILEDDVLPESGLYPEHDPHRYVVEEAENVYDRTDFILNYLTARDSDAQRIRDSW